jgi:hypothetical protein
MDAKDRNNLGLVTACSKDYEDYQAFQVVN